MKTKSFKTISFCYFLLLSLNLVFSQTPTWKLLPASPYLNDRIDDLFFINPQTGWIVGGNATIHKTTNGGLTWQHISTVSGYLRSVCFLDSLTGFLGKLDGPMFFYKTVNGGLNWSAISMDSNAISRVCGLSSFGNTVIASGWFNGNPKVAISTNRGVSWKNINMINYANALVDCYMTGPTEAFVVGGIGSHYENRKAVILYTSNAGDTWETRFISSRIKNWGWKISFPSTNVGYVSLENSYSLDSSFFAKTTNGGLNWVEKYYGIGMEYREQGIGFVNENTGWMGGYNKFLATTNGGDNWSILNIAPEFSAINRIRFYSDTIGYASGLRVYKYTTEDFLSNINVQNTIPGKNSLHQNYPNPFNPVTVIKFEIFEKSVSTIKIYNAAGEEVYSFAHGYRTPGIIEFAWYGTDYNGNLMPSGVYFYRLETEKYTETKKMILVR